MKKALTAVLSVTLLCGCGNSDETYRPEGYFYPAEQKESTAYSEISAPPAVYTLSPSSSSESAARSVPAAPNDGVLRQTFTSDERGLAFTMENIFSDGEYYTVVASAAKTDTKDINTIYINGGLYEKPELALFKNGQQLDLIKIGIPTGDRFMTLESAADNYSYGSEIISNMREYGAAEYPDIFGLVFRSGAEAAVPEYARYFAVFGGKLAELAIYENGIEVSPRGAKLEPIGAGEAKQYLTVLKASGEGYEIIKYEYSFDLENRRLNRTQVRFYGWDY